MSILIKDMKMPTSCSECVLNYDCFKCIVTGTPFFDHEQNFDDEITRMDNCPLVELPLLATSMPQLNIFSPTLDSEWQKEHKAMGFWSPLADLYEELEIIPAEEGE